MRLAAARLLAAHLALTLSVGVVVATASPAVRASASGAAAEGLRRRRRRRRRVSSLIRLPTNGKIDGYNAMEEELERTLFEDVAALSRGLALSAPPPPPGETPTATCGNGSVGNGKCPNPDHCCSEWGWCDTGPGFCGDDEGEGEGDGGGDGAVSESCGGGSVGNGVCPDETLCCSQYGWCGSGPDYCDGSTAPCGTGRVGKGVCEDDMKCCSAFGWCGDTVEHCGEGGLDGGIYAPAKTLTSEDLQAGLDEHDTLGYRLDDAVPVTREIVDEINDATAEFTLYRQIAFVAHIMWESQGLGHTEEIKAVNPPYETRDHYQTCDWDTGEQATNGKYFYGRGYKQLSWCANYKAYGRDRLINGDPDFFYNNPELVATEYAMDSAVWFFETAVHDRSGRFGDTTRDVNGPLECDGDNREAAVARYQIFVALADQVGLVGYSEEGCYV